MHAHTTGWGPWCSLTTSEVGGSRHISKSVQVDDVNDGADHPGWILESRNRTTHDSSSHHSATDQGMAQTPGSIKQGELPCCLCFSWTSAHRCLLLCCHISSAQELAGAAPKGRGAQGHDTKRGRTVEHLGEGPCTPGPNLLPLLTLALPTESPLLGLGVCSAPNLAAKPQLDASLCLPSAHSSGYSPFTSLKCI